MTDKVLPAFDWTDRHGRIVGRFPYLGDCMAAIKKAGIPQGARIVEHLPNGATRGRGGERGGSLYVTSYGGSGR